MPDQIVNSELALAKLEHDHQLARLGLQGTLWGAWAALIAIVAIAAIQVATGRYVLEGWAFTGMVAVIVIPVTFYGAFIFNRALSVSAKIAGGSISANSSDPKKSKPDTDSVPPR